MGSVPSPQSSITLTHSPRPFNRPFVCGPVTNLPGLLYRMRTRPLTSSPSSQWILYMSRWPHVGCQLLGTASRVHSERPVSAVEHRLEAAGPPSPLHPLPPVRPSLRPTLSNLCIHNGFISDSIHLPEHTILYIYDQWVPVANARVAAVALLTAVTSLIAYAGIDSDLRSNPILCTILYI